MQNYVESIEKNSPQSTLLVYSKRCFLGLTESPSLSIGLYKGQYRVAAINPEFFKYFFKMSGQS